MLLGLACTTECIKTAFACCSELKRRMKQEQKAKEKAEKDKLQQAAQCVKKEATAALKEEEISPNVRECDI